jgi:hypothetical protein
MGSMRSVCRLPLVEPLEDRIIVSVTDAKRQLPTTEANTAPTQAWYPQRSNARCSARPDRRPVQEGAALLARIPTESAGTSRRSTVLCTAEFWPLLSCVARDSVQGPAGH